MKNKIDNTLSISTCTVKLCKNLLEKLTQQEKIYCHHNISKKIIVFK